MKRKWLLATSMVAAGALLGATPAHAAGQTYGIQGSATGPSDSFFGYSVAVDGNTAVVGAFNDNASIGAAYVFVRSGTTWSAQQELTPPDGAASDEFGYAVSISGNTILVDSLAASGGKGTVYAFTRSGVTWSLQQEFTSTDGASGDCFGCALALSGTTAVIGAPGRLGGTGAAYLYVKGTSWSSQQELGGSSSSDAFGFSVGLTPDASTAVVGAYGSANQGRAYIFTKSGTWAQAPAQQIVAASDAQTNDRFGYAVAASAGAILVGAYQHGGSGAAYLFTGSGTSWTQSTELSPSDGANGDFFGYSVALSGSTAVVGAYEKRGTTGPGAGYIFTNDGASWSQSEVFAPTAGQSFGYAVAAGPATAVIGAFGNANDAGAFYVLAPVAAAAPAMGRASNLWLLSLALVAAGGLANRRAKKVRA
jgi:hypothetical protein